MAKVTDAEEKLIRFLRIVKSDGRGLPNHVWGEQIRRALSDDLVKVGWGGVLELTPAGREQCIDNLMSKADVANAALQAYEAAQPAKQAEARSSEQSGVRHD